MAAKEEFEITISPTGEIQVEVKGAQGKSCLELTEFLEKALGEVKDRQLKPEYYTQEKKQKQETRRKP